MAQTHLLWLDLESTGGDDKLDHILEVGVVLTPINDLDTVLFEGEWLVAEDWDAAHHRLEDNPVVMQMHQQSGLLARLQDSPLHMLAEVDREIAWQLDTRKIKPGEVLLAGSGISHFDRRFVKRDLDAVESFLHYGNLDIGVARRVLKYLDGAWLLPVVPESQDMASKSHRALDDARAHLLEARLIKANFASAWRMLDEYGATTYDGR